MRVYVIQTQIKLKVAELLTDLFQARLKSVPPAIYCMNNEFSHPSIILAALCLSNMECGDRANHPPTVQPIPLISKF